MSTCKTILEPASMRYAKPLAFPQAAFCEQIINIGLFFDGTDDNPTRHRGSHNPAPARTHSQPRPVPCQEAA
ncbi:hypothetical protein [uncultured Pseudacidovorax sp.]|uniref:hypothetical protein n=1 Tax=uncultured Pseudacidovorax sp. TaxID=679313 RepID=UPI0025CDCCE8|nr:hypothetical protein [uncultured Pseudacidovorax sp.]